MTEKATGVQGARAGLAILVASTTYPRIVCARYTEELHEANEGAWMFAYVVLLAIGAKYIHEELKKGPVAAGKAIAIVGSLSVAAYFFPIINGILIVLAVIAFAYGMLKAGRP